MRKIYFFFSCWAFCMPFMANSQNPCGTFEESKWLDYYFEHKHEFLSADTPWLYVPVTMHVVGNDEGGGYFGQPQILAALCNMNEQYVPAKMQFYLHPTDPFVYHNSTYWYTHDWDGGDDLINNNRLPNRLNAFIVDDPAGNCGYSWQEAIVLGKGCSGPKNTTWAHEVGHHFSLPHTFSGWEGRDWDWSTPAPANFGQRQVEKVDRSNCQTAGDRFCDTYPDYISGRWTCNQDGESYTMLDPNGEEFRADGTLYMSYANDECANKFSGEQMEAMRASLQFEFSDYLVTNQPGEAITEAVALTSPAAGEMVQYNSFVLDWEAVPNADYYIVEISLLPNFPFTFVKRITTDNEYNVEVNLPLNRSLYWRVRPFSNWSFCDLDMEPEVRELVTANLVATNDLEKKAVVSLSPNPALSGQAVQMEVEASITFEAALLIYDINGRQVGQKTVQVFEGKNTLTFDTFGFAAGTYRAVLQNETGNVQRVFAILN